MCKIYLECKSYIQNLQTNKLLIDSIRYLRSICLGNRENFAPQLDACRFWFWTSSPRKPWQRLVILSQPVIFVLQKWNSRRNSNEALRGRNYFSCSFELQWKKKEKKWTFNLNLMWVNNFTTANLIKSTSSRRQQTTAELEYVQKTVTLLWWVNRDE